MPEPIDAGPVTTLLRQINFAGQPQLTEMQDTPAFRASEDVKASRVQEKVKLNIRPIDLNLANHLHQQEVFSSG